MMSTNNILSPAHGKPIIVPSQDMVLGTYHMTRDRAFEPIMDPKTRQPAIDPETGIVRWKKVKGSGQIFSCPEEVRIAFDAGEVDLQAPVVVRMKNFNASDEKPLRVETTVGRVILREILPPQVPFSAINKIMSKRLSILLTPATDLQSEI
jgi:DNA-directed RNA polymerase subunit beta'